MDDAEDSEIIFKWTNSCRICLKADAPIDIFTSPDSESIIIKIQNILNSLIYKGDPLPRKLCAECLDRLKNSFEIKQIGVNTEKDLKKRLQQYCQLDFVQKYFDKCQKFSSPESLITSSQEASESDISKLTTSNINETVGSIISVAGCASEVWNETPIASQIAPLTVIKQENGSLTCYNCNLTFINLSEFELYKTGHSLTFKFCTKCFISFSDTTIYNVHDCVRNGEVDPVETETNCNKSLIIYEEVITKVEPKVVELVDVKKCYRFAKITPWKCVLCDCYFNSKLSFQQHFIEQNCVQYLSSCFKCEYCFRYYYTFHQLLQHQLFHISICLNLTEEALLNCKDCNKRFADEDRLKQHCLSHLSIDSSDNTTLKTEDNKFRTMLVKCNICEQLISSRSNCKRHLMQVHGVPANDCDKTMQEVDVSASPIRCRYCGTMFQTELSLKNHEELRHRNKTPFSCKKCPQRFSTRTLLLIHLRDHENKVVPSTSDTQDESPSTSSQAEVKSETKDDGFKCPLCPLVSASSYEIATHIIFSHPDKPSTPQPVQTPNTDANTNDGAKYRCTKCSKLFAHKRSLRAHFRKFHRVENKPSAAAVGGSSSSSSNEIQAQVAKKSTGGEVKQIKLEDGEILAGDGRVSLSCKYCSKKFTTNYKRMVHESIHKSSSFKVIKCKICQKRFVNGAAYEYHKQVAHEKVTYHCPNCNNVYYNQTTLYTHNCIHETDQTRKTFRCLKCPKSYESLKALKQHIKVTHLMSDKKEEELVDPVWQNESNKIVCQVGDKYYCTYCDVEFSALDMCNEHEKEHPGGNLYVIKVSEKQYQCTICNKTFDKSEVDYHMEVHKSSDLGNEINAQRKTTLGMKKNFECPFCGIKYFSESNLNNHIYYVHPDISITPVTSN